jgi:hypothetical protein
MAGDHGEVCNVPFGTMSANSGARTGGCAIWEHGTSGCHCPRRDIAELSGMLRSIKYNMKCSYVG